MATFESQNRRMPKIEACLKANGLESLDACNEMLLAKGIDCDKIIRGIQPICFDNAVWAYTLGTAIAVKRGGEILPGKTILEALNTDLVCDAINVAMRELFLQIVYGRSQTAFSENGLPVGAGLDDLGKGLRSMTGTIFSTKAKGVRYLELTEGYILKTALDKDNQVIGYQFVRLGKMLEAIRHGMDPKEAYEKNIGTYGRFSAEQGAVKYIDPREE